MKIVERKGFKTPTGIMFPIYRDWDEEFHGYDIKMVYVTTMTPNNVKGPILHKERKYLITATSGTVYVEFYEDGKIEKVCLHDETEPSSHKILMLDEGVPIRLITAGTEIATIVNCPSKAWHPDNPDTYRFSSWEEYLGM